MHRIVIAGAGISGLALAWELLKRGVAPLVLEGRSRPGGLIHSERSHGFLVENGPQSFPSADPIARELLAELDLGSQVVLASPAARRRCVLADGQVREVPLTPAALMRSSTLTAASKARLFLDLALPRGRAGRGEDESVARFGHRRFGARGAERLFFPLMSGLYTSDPEAISLPAAFPRYARLERDRRTVLRGTMQAVRSTGLATFREGMGTLPAALATKIGEHLKLDVRVESVRRAGARWRVNVNARGVRTEMETEAIVLALPSYAAASALETADGTLAASVAQIRYSSLAVVYAGYRCEARPRAINAYGFYVPSSEPSRLLGAVFTSSLFPGHAPRDHTLVACRMGGARDPALLARPDGEMSALAHAELCRVLGARDPPVFERVVRHPHALPQYALGHTQRIDVIEAAARRLPGLFLTGNAYRGLGLLDCLRQARTLAPRFADYVATSVSAGL